jgi:hypothetical protein
VRPARLAAGGRSPPRTFSGFEGRETERPCQGPCYFPMTADQVVAAHPTGALTTNGVAS